MRSSLTESRPAPNTNATNMYRSWPSPGPQPSPVPPPVARPRRRLNLVPSEGWLSLLLLSIAVYSVVYSVTAAIMVNHGDVLWITTALGLLCGLVVSKNRFFSQAAMHVAAAVQKRSTRPIAAGASHILNTRVVSVSFIAAYRYCHLH